MRRVVLPLLAVMLLSCAELEELPEAPKGEPRAEAGLHYTGDVAIDEVTSSLQARLSITLRSLETSQVTFLLNGGLEVSSLSGVGVESFVVRASTMNADWNEIVVSIDPAAVEEALVIEIEYGGKPIFADNGLNQISVRWVELNIDSAWHPFLADLDRELTARLRLQLPAAWDVVSSGTAKPIDDGYELTIELPQLDIAWVGSPDLQVARGDHDVIYHRGVSEGILQRVLGTAEACRLVLDRRFGAKRRLPPSRLVMASRSEGGYARKNYIMLTDVEDMDRAALTTFLCHEFAHFWSAGARPFTVDNWLNEGFAEFVAARATREIVGEAAYAEAVEDWTRRSEGQTSIWNRTDVSRRPFAVNYKKAPLALSRLQARVGNEAFEEILVRYMTEPINETTVLLAAVEDAAGPEARGWFEAVLAEDETTTEVGNGE